MTITLPTVHESSRQRAVVSNRNGGPGAGFGDVYLETSDGLPEVRFLWGPDGSISVSGESHVTRSQKNRAVRALAESPFGRRVLGLGSEYDPESVPSADEEELFALRAAATAAGILPSEPAPAPKTASEPSPAEITVRVRIEVERS